MKGVISHKQQQQRPQQQQYLQLNGWQQLPASCHPGICLVLQQQTADIDAALLSCAMQRSFSTAKSKRINTSEESLFQ
jgi:hypothetical protein